MQHTTYRRTENKIQDSLRCIPVHDLSICRVRRGWRNINIRNENMYNKFELQQQYLASSFAILSDSESRACEIKGQWI